MADSIVNKFVFPPDRFPSLSLKPECSFDQEEFGPPLTFDLNSSECRELQDYQEVGFEFTPTPDEIARKQMEILYSVEGDDYLRPNSPQSRIFRWNSGVFRSFNIQKTVENDWRMAYLSRKCVAVGDNRGNNLCGLIEWRFNLEGYGMRVKKLFVRLPHQTYRDGKVRVLICSRNDYAVIMDPHNLKPVFRAYGWQDFVLRVELSGEKSDDTCENTYQNAQLFRQPCPQLASNPDWKHPFKIILEMEPAESLNCSAAVDGCDHFPSI